MRMLMKVQMDVAAGNRAVQSGELQATMERMMRELEPEASYFGPLDGKRTALFFFDLQDASQIPPAGEPFFTALEATVEMTPMMTREDLAKGLGALGAT
jgi:hypothetical protein